ncbi:sigma-70 family RNA polymerase sigma factor [Erythrobacter sp.]|jgi:RNA polymerase sigma-70 factor (ECF subfamily)|uniref:sigma-70 family RNA polymerase sigma factor n=1 Tax=Erythrobacter sp. TaxID=1042 RepID=UPI002EBA8120|nr:sigma-70 family RNA polymerase sigma factor [Erythrobacter sp.]
MAGSPPGADEASGRPVGDDAAVLARIAKRDEAAFRQAIDDHARLLHRIAYRMTGDAHEAEDIAQEAILRLWDHAPRLAAGPKPVRIGAWLTRVATNLAIDRLRLSKRMSNSEVPESADAEPLADAQMESEQTHDAARALIGALPERQRAAIVLTYYEELPNAEAAGAMDMNIKAFESLLHRARAALRVAFEHKEAAR